MSYVSTLMNSTLILGDDEKSLNMALHIIDCFAVCSGLWANFDKTQVLKFGGKQGCGEELRAQKPIIWNHERTFKRLGTEYEVNSEDITGKNYKNKIKSVKTLLNDWSFRSLSLIGKVCIIKKLAYPFYTFFYSLTSTTRANFKRDRHYILRLYMG